MRTVVLLCGPPGAGKTTAARQSGLQVFDRDDPQWSGESEFREAIAALAEDPAASAVVIRAGASSSARRKAAALVGATHVWLLLADPTELGRRVRERRRSDFVAGVASIKSWFVDFDRGDRVQSFPGWSALSGDLPIGATSRSW